MKYCVEFKPKALKDLKFVSSNQSKKILEKIEEMSLDLKGDVKKLTNFTPEYRLRVGEYRVLFEIDSEKIVVYRIAHRKEVYR